MRRSIEEKWFGPAEEDLEADGETLKRPVHGSEWPFGPPSWHAKSCALHAGGLRCSCLASKPVPSHEEGGVGRPPRVPVGRESP